MVLGILAPRTANGGSVHFGLIQAAIEILNILEEI
jgi:hypothetical protein